MLAISNTVTLPEAEIEWQAVRAQGAGGQKVNKTNSAVHLRFSIPDSSLPEIYKSRLMARAGTDQRITRDGTIVIKAQQYRSQDANLEDARQRLATILAAAGQAPKKRRPTRPSKTAKRKRTDDKKRRGRLKALRGRGRPSD
ncbi:alternative ribosome rescue aminoacyl-tRNA hydrolase ArfB [Salinisphaera hydrothermalis]|uniref:Class I peptide chain release factor n=1 Tax=Salinisphaera hydrothermalis (strain C41B8) TaxID=1304275 RepID=A0A084IHD3_SALHC|nr:alternative ribosome rescue aminoacyl-tRNA hydrolase ArfB [Salinisphaera hydrothermalis]KEZ76117.1 class I peptide chain release factor [Salinisphaera hydrothermalis C41B8]